MAGIEDQHEKLATVPDSGAGQHQAHHLTPRELSWRPDSHSTSESAKRWQEGNTLSRQEKLTVDAHGKYKVTDVDALSTIAERNLHTHGTAQPSEKALRQEMDRIVALNKDEYPDLGKNPDLLHAGMELRMRHHHKSHPTHIDIPPVHQADGQAPAPVRRPQSDAPVSPAPSPLPAPSAEAAAAAPYDTAAAPYNAGPAPQSFDRSAYAPPQSNDIGQGIASFFGSFLGGIGSGVLNAGALGRGYYDRGYNPGWGQYDQGPGSYDQGWSGFNPGLAVFNQDNGVYNSGWRGGYNHPWRNHNWRGR